ncbi:MAG TPA: anti-sigma factor [Blastocatellia bacterium]|nr:anti-sigma factor [Blastocatellia bacterium]
MLCNDCQDNLSDYIDGALELGEQVRVERHLADCEPCRIVRDDLLQIVHFGRRLPLQTPSSAVWTKIQARISEEQPSGFWKRGASWWARIQQRHVNLNIPQLAASAAALMILVSAAMVGSRQNVINPSDVVTNQMIAPQARTNLLSSPDLQEMEQTIDGLKRQIESRKASWTPELRVAFERNMVHVDQSLLECRQELNHNPSDQFSQDLMLNAYREKMRVLDGFSKF